LRCCALFKLRKLFEDMPTITQQLMSLSYTCGFELSGQAKLGWSWLRIKPFASIKVISNLGATKLKK